MWLNVDVKKGKNSQFVGEIIIKASRPTYIRRSSKKILLIFNTGNKGKRKVQWYSTHTSIKDDNSNRAVPGAQANPTLPQWH